MRQLILYWNELTFPKEPGLADVDGCKHRANEAFAAFKEACGYQPGARISVAKGAFHAEHFGRNLLSWLEQWLGRDKLRFIKAKAIQPLEAGEPLLHELVCEVRRGDRCGEGLTRAHLAESWVWSLKNRDEGSDAPIINAQKRSMDDSGNMSEGPVEISNIAEEAHANHWRERIAAWGSNVAESCVIGNVQGNRVIMYPLDHGYPHIHVEYGEQMYKYRVDVFEGLNATPLRLDALLRPWVADNSASLLESWRRCSSGLRPLRIGA